MPRAFWKGIISFGLVAIPVKMSVATESTTMSFHLLHQKCLTRPRQVLHCETDNEYFSIKDTVRGYEVQKEQFVVLEEGDFNNVPVKTTHAIEIAGFVDSKEIDPIYYYGCHYVEPEELGAKPFCLLREALEKTERVGIAKVVFQRREHLCSLRPMEDILVLHTLHYQNEILSHKEISPSKPKVTASELDMAVSLIKAMSKSFRPEDYRDEYQDALKQVVEAKLSGEKIIVPAEPKMEIVDLMSALRASIESAKKATSLR
ncbi:MAG: Ku protein [Candidatus Tectomicrobia bacterium]|uniref:Non-homologous end joining protein Ku n=1 Tax=Tectimicrobiota bacterium TaxID=2528274 RepID=A0A933GLR4_UNCTE|nr:Ku protein [Candidatus Tectomicrobia bacterium]